jgi:hypothetical protein
MAQEVDTLAGTVILLGTRIQDKLAMAMESDDLPNARQLLKEADEAMSTLLEIARETQPDIE